MVVSCPNDEVAPSELYSLADPTKLLVIKSLEYEPQNPEDNGFCPADECLPSIGFNVTGRDGAVFRDCVKNNNDDYFCINSTKIKWNGNEFIFDGIILSLISRYLNF